MKQLKSKEAEITAQVKQKESQRRKMQQALTALIRREIQEAERKEKERSVDWKQRNIGG